MSKEHLRAIARHLIGKVLGLKVTAKNITIEEYEGNFVIPEYLVFSIKGVEKVNYTLREQPNGKYRFYINGAFVCSLELSDFEVE
ncbi:MAG: hypothetical protein LIR46_07735 [Bacteroidota bacterium]|nr:hypothetical protein [Bacteroidota bacterium]